MRHPAIRLRIFLCALLGATLLASGSGLAAQQSGEAAIASAHPLATAAGREILEARRQRVRRRGRGRRGARRGRAVLVGAGRRRLLAAAPRLRRIPGDGRRARDGAARRRGRSFSTPRASRATRRLPRRQSRRRFRVRRPRWRTSRGRYGRLPLAASLAPGDPLRARGLRGGSALRAHRGDARAPPAGDPAAARIFLDERPCSGGGLRPQPAGARGDAGAARAARALPVSTAGTVARALVEAVNSAGGVWQLADLAEYRVVEREPVRFQYRGATITAAALPSAGGIALAQALGMLERFAPADARRARRPITSSIEALRRAFHDRARYLGDPDFVTRAGGRGSCRSEYAQRRASTSIRRTRRRSDCAGRGARRARGESRTRRICRSIDAKATASRRRSRSICCSARASLRRATGVLLNNEMDDFTLATRRAERVSAARRRRQSRSSRASGRSRA